MNLFQVFIAILCVLNPIGGINISSRLMNNGDSYKPVKVFAMSFFCISFSLIILAAVAKPLLNTLGFQSYAIHLGGGVLLVIIGVLNMLKLPDKTVAVNHTSPIVSKAPSKKSFLSDYWLGFNPIYLASFSPATILVDINYSLMANSVNDKLWIIITLILSSFVFCTLLISATWIKNKFSASSLLFFTRLIGLIITAVAFQMIVSGASSVLPIVLGDSLTRLYN